MLHSLSLPICYFRFSNFVLEGLKFEWQYSQYLELNLTCCKNCVLTKGAVQLTLRKVSFNKGSRLPFNFAWNLHSWWKWGKLKMKSKSQCSIVLYESTTKRNFDWCLRRRAIHHVRTSMDSDKFLTNVKISKDSEFGFTMVVYKKCFTILKYLEEIMKCVSK